MDDLEEIEADAAAGVASIPEDMWVFRRSLECFDLWASQDMAIEGMP